ncbi:MAG: VOC family protein [Pseudomonadota bacterium]
MSTENNLPQQSGTVVWFEIPVTDIDASQKFYEAVLGIKMIKTEKSDEQPNDIVWFNDPSAPGSFGHLYPGQPGTDGNGNTVHMLSADKLEEAMVRVEEAGGQVVSPIIPIPTGRFVYITDLDGNSVGLFNWA